MENNITLNLKNKVLVFVGWFMWWSAFQNHFTDTPRRAIFALSVHIMKGPFAYYMSHGLRETFSGVELVYFSKWHKESALRMKGWIEENFPQVPSVSLRYIPKKYDEIT